MENVVNNDEHSDHEDRLFVVAKSVVGQIFEQGRTASNALESVAKALQLGDFVVDHYESKFPLTEPLACKAGCHYCCFYEVWLTPPEALLVAHWVEQGYSEVEKEELMNRIEAALQRADSIDGDKGAKTRHDRRCIFLTSGKCCVYEVRPFICRALHALDSGECKRAVEFKSRTAEFAGYSHRYDIYQAVKAGFREVCIRMGCQMDMLPIGQAVKQCFERAELGEAWIRGDSAFAA